jgi:hypothetical protein
VSDLLPRKRRDRGRSRDHALALSRHGVGRTELVIEVAFEQIVELDVFDVDRLLRQRARAESQAEQHGYGEPSIGANGHPS